MVVAVKTLAWVAVAVLVGAAVRRYWLAPGKRGGYVVLAVAASSVPVLGAVELWATLSQLRTPDLELWWRYASTTAHGHAVGWRSVAAVALGGVVAVGPRALWPLAAALAVWLCYGFSRLSHGAAMGGVSVLVVDLVHLAGAAVWAGAVWHVAFGGPRDRGGASGQEPVERLSRLATWVVAAIAATGVVSGLVHVSEPARFFGSGYALALGVKLALVALTLGLAAANRWVLLPRARRGAAGIEAALYVESALLLAVLAATGWLTTSPVPHGELGDVNVLENARRVIEHLAP